MPAPGILQKHCRHKGLNVEFSGQDVQSLTKTTEIHKLANEPKDKLPGSCSSPNRRALKGFLSPWRRFLGLGLHADSSIRENARRERGLCLAGFQKRIWLSEKQPFYAATA
jgi:hypothetical protein